MDLGAISWRTRFCGEGERADASALFALAAARQAVSPTAVAQARLPLPRPRRGGAFAGPATAASLLRTGP